MKPFLSYGWQPQVMAVDGRTKAILAGRLEVYDVVADPAESRDLAADAPPCRGRPAPPCATTRSPRSKPRVAPDNLGDEERQKLASLGYVSAGAAARGAQGRATARAT